MLKLPSRLRYGVCPLAPVLAVLLAPASMAQQAVPAPADPEQENTRPIPVEQRTTAPREDETYVLSPFVVTTTNDRGYYAANTLAGSRMNTNLADLAGSISVITKQQFDDTASTDLNDIFRYEASTEGSLTFTPGQQSFRNDGVVDVIAGATLGNAVSSFTNAGANRVRGIGPPSTAINYYLTNRSLPMDSYNTQSLEITRGPNALLYGLGSPAGIANQSTAQAQLNKQSASLSLRTDQHGSFRSALNFNQGLIKDRLAIYGAALYDDRHFQRKPSYDKTERFYGAITVKPFSKTTIRANIEKYDNNNRRPNTLTPRDFVTQWNLAGQPYYDPVTKKVYSLQTGQELKMMVNNASSPLAQSLRDFIMSRPGYNPALRGTSATNFNGTNTNFTFYNGLPIFGNTHWGIPAGWVAGTPSPNILFTPGIGEVNQGRSIMQIADGQLVNWFQPTYNYRYLPGFGVPGNPAGNPALYPAETAIWANPTWADIYTRTFTSSQGWTGAGNGILASQYRYPGVTDKSIYDWTEVNINSMNFGVAGSKNYNVEFEQELPWNLFFNAGWFRQDYKQRTNYTVAQLNVATLFVDTNVRLPNGAPNPYFGKPYLEDQDPDSYYNASLDDHFRAMLAWTPDFTRTNNWTKWLGRHQALGMWSRDDYLSTSIRQRLHYTAAADDAGRFRYLRNPNPTAAGAPTGWNMNTTSLRRTYYLAAPNDPNGVVTRAAGTWDPLSYRGDITVWDYDQGRFIPVNMTTEFIDFDAGTGRSRQIIDSVAAGLTSYLWENRLITTVGVRRDKFRSRNTNTVLSALTEADNVTQVSPAITNQQKWVDGVFQRDFLFNRWDRWTRLEYESSTLGGVLRPFQSWNRVEQNAATGSLWWQFVRDFGVSYNQSDNFNPPSAAFLDFYRKPLPLPTGEGKDWGIQFALMDRKLFARLNWFESTYDRENIAAPIVFTRLSNNIDQDNFRNWARTIAMINMGMDPTAAGFGTNLSQPQETAVQAAAAQIWGLPYDYYGFTRGATRSMNAKGMEVELNYTPNRNWTLKFTLTKQDTKYGQLLREFDPWAADRMAVWRAARAADYLLPQYQHLATYTTSGGRQVDLTNFWSSYGYHSSLFPENANAFANPEANWNGVVVPQVTVDRDLEGQSVSGQRKYRWSFVSNYNFDRGRLKGLGLGGSLRWEDKSVIGYAGKASGINLYGGVPVLDYADVSRPYYDNANYYTDLWVSYRFSMWKDKVRAKVQLNVANVFEDGGLRPVAVNYDGSPYSFRIIEPRQFTLTTTLEF